jgi:hypothetical protein
MVLSESTERQVTDLHKIGVEIDNDYRHTIDNYAIKHNTGRHGKESETLRGQVPITDEDY